MKEVMIKHPFVIENPAPKRVSAKAKARIGRWLPTLYLSFITGAFSALAGLVLGAFSYLGVFGEAADVVNQIGNLLIIAAFPLLMLGAHALDKISEIKKRAGD